jgi:Flp pilus assembly protein TadG
MASMSRTERLRRRGERGAELIELAFVLPILLLVVSAIMDFGFLFQRYEVVTNAAREGARMSTMPNYTDNDIRARVQQYLAASGLTSPPNPFCTITAPANVTLSTGTAIQVRTVTVRYPATFSYIGAFASMVGGGSWSSIMLTAQSTMRTEPGSAGGS